MSQVSNLPQVTINIDNLSQGYKVFVPRNQQYQTTPAQMNYQQPASMNMSQNNTYAPQIDLMRNSSFQPNVNYANEVNAVKPFYPTSDFQSKHQEQPYLKSANSSQFAMSSPQLVTSRSTNQAIGNLRKQAFEQRTSNDFMPFADQQTNTNAYFQSQQMPNSFVAHNQMQMSQSQSQMGMPLKRTFSKQFTFEGPADQMLTKKSSFISRKNTLDFNDKFVLNSAPPKMMGNGPLTTIPMLDLKVAQSKANLDQMTPVTGSTNNSSQGSYCNSDEDEPASFESLVASPYKRMVKQAPIRKAAPVIEVNACSPAKRNTMKQENSWKRKVKTELCRFWLMGLSCENQMKEQGCGFAHGQEELQKKKTLSRQYLTSVCKNFLEHPSKCTYGARCIFQHPSNDVKVRQTYSTMVQDNQRYTAMRLFQDIEGADVFYINTYAATTPRLATFKNICSNAKDNEENDITEQDWADVADMEIPDVQQILGKKSMGNSQ